MALASKIASGTYTAEELITFGRILARDAVVVTRQDEKLRLDNAIGLAQSKNEMTLTRRVKFYQAATMTLVGIASGAGLVMATCMNAYQDARVDAAVPAVRAEAKAEIAKKQTDVLVERMDDSDARIEAVEASLTEIKESLAANTAAVVGLAAAMGKSPPPATEKPSRKAIR